jgi:hypothetical protein
VLGCRGLVWGRGARAVFANAVLQRSELSHLFLLLLLQLQTHRHTIGRLAKWAKYYSLSHNLTLHNLYQGSFVHAHTTVKVSAFSEQQITHKQKKYLQLILQ